MPTGYLSDRQRELLISLLNEASRPGVQRTALQQLLGALNAVASACSPSEQLLAGADWQPWTADVAIHLCAIGASIRSFQGASYQLIISTGEAAAHCAPCGRPCSIKFWISDLMPVRIECTEGPAAAAYIPVLQIFCSSVPSCYHQGVSSWRWYCRFCKPSKLSILLQEGPFATIFEVKCSLL